MVVVAKKHLQQAPPESFEEQVLRRYDVIGLKVETIAEDLHTTTAGVRGILLAFGRIEPTSRPRTIAPPPITKRRGGTLGPGVKAKAFVSPVDTTLEPLGPEGDFPPANTCTWAYGDPGRDRDWRMCGRPQRSGKPYCDAHAARAFDSAGTRRLQAQQG